MSIGEKIRKERTYQKLSQKQLAEKVGISEPAIRNYELGNRTPNEKHLASIAGALGVSPFVISEPDLDTNYGIIHALFYLENTIHIQPEMIEGQPYLKIPANTYTYEAVNNWYKALSAFQNGEMSEEEYKEWKDTYPEQVIFNKR